MNAGEHWWIYRCPDCGATGTSKDGNVRMPCMCDGPVEPIEVIRAADHRGAVGEATWVNDDRTVLVSRWDDGAMVVATRPDPDAIWGPPFTLRRERQS